MWHSLGIPLKSIMSRELGCSRDKHGKGCVTTKLTSLLHPTADFVLSAKSFVFYFCRHLSPFILNPSSFVSILRTPLEEVPLLEVFHWDKFRLASTHLWHIPYWAILKKQLICRWCERMYLCGFVSLYVRIFVARANKVEGTMSWCLGTNEILASI